MSVQSAHTDTRVGKRAEHIAIGTFIEGISSAHWQDPRYASDGNSSIESFIEFAEIAEAGKLDFGFIADTSYVTRETAWHILSRLEPVTALSALAVSTSHLGLVGTVSTSYSQPFDVARQFASLDRLSGGRAGWNAVTSYLAGHAANYSAQELPPKQERYEIANEFVEVVKRLWRSWESDAFVRDRESGQYVDWSKSHPANFSGRHFSVRGPLNVERSVQGEPVVFQAGSSPEGVQFGAAHADATFVAQLADPAATRERYAAWKQAARQHGRQPESLLVLQSLNPIVGATEAEARSRYEERTRFAGIEHALGVIARYFQYFDFGTIDLDAPFPDGFIERASEGFTSYASLILEDAELHSLSVREAALRHVYPDPSFVGSAESITERIIGGFEDRQFDGLILTLDKGNLRRFTELVIPRLQQRGLFRLDYEPNNTLRQNLGVPNPALDP